MNFRGAKQEEKTRFHNTTTCLPRNNSRVTTASMSLQICHFLTKDLAELNLKLNTRNKQ